MLHFVYSIVNFLILFAVLWIFARKTVAAIFSSRREKIGRELDEAERIEAELAAGGDDLPAIPASLPDKAPAEALEEAAAIRRRGEEDAAAIARKTEETVLGMRREALFDVRSKVLDSVIARAAELLKGEPYQSAIRAKEEAFADEIVARMEITPGDIAYLKRHDILYVTLTSARELPQSIVDRIGKRAEEMLAEVGGKPSYWVKVDPELIGGFRFRVGDTVYDFTVADRLYRVRNAMAKRPLTGNETPEQLAADLLDGILS
ncbi:MAG: F0F1 ATP synthase subunit delta, partial [Clostridia bacterium]|nr:F0F1 ATP synthase subunit delta [Clostridia bacterium]